MAHTRSLGRGRDRRGLHEKRHRGGVSCGRENGNWFGVDSQPDSVLGSQWPLLITGDTWGAQIWEVWRWLPKGSLPQAGARWMASRLPCGLTLAPAPWALPAGFEASFPDPDRFNVDFVAYLQRKGSYGDWHSGTTETAWDMELKPSGFQFWLINLS